MSAPLLELRGVEVAYGGIRAVQGVDLQLQAGERVALIGANGAGKSTLLKALAGLLPLRAGQVWRRGVDISAEPVHRRSAGGLALVPEGRGIFKRLTVAENLDLGAYLRRDPAGVRADRDTVYGRFPRLAERRQQKAGTLSGGEQQMLAIGRALMGRPEVLLLDEPSMGLAPILVQKIFQTIRDISAQGVTLLLVEQNAKAALEVCERGIVMDGGRFTLTGPAADLLDNPAVRAAYLGE